MAREVDFLTFFILWAKLQGWTVPLLHVRICRWLELCDDPVRVLMVFRGAAKSTIYAVYKAWKLYRNRAHRSLVWSADNETAGMLTADTINVLRLHPLTAGMLPTKPGAKRFWVRGSRDARNASMRAIGVNSNATGARADDVDYDDIEVPGNIESPEARLKLRQRISESTHIAVPGAQKTYIGTPHAHDSIYPEQVAAGAALLKIPLFEHIVRFEKTQTLTYEVPFDPGDDGYYVLLGIHKGARLLVEGMDYLREGRTLRFREAPVAVMDVCTGCAWPERFTRDEIEKRRRETRTLNEWDSQYHLEAKPINQVRLDPTRIVPYDAVPVFRSANNARSMWLGKVNIVAAASRWDPAGGKLKSDVSAFAVVLQDDGGRRYLHKVEALDGELAEFAADGKTITGGQVWQLCDIVEALSLPRVSVETNGIGGFAPVVLRACLKQRRLICGVVEVTSTTNKNKRILETFEPLLLSRGMLWGHMAVLRITRDGKTLESPFWQQMREWNPAVQDQADDYLDAAAGAISETPERFRGLAHGNGGIPRPGESHDWRPSGGEFEVTFER